MRATRAFFFKPNTGAMQCLIKVAESQVHHKWAVSRSIQELSEWMLCYLPQQPRHSRIYASRIIVSTLASLSYWTCTSRNNGMMSSKKIFITIKARADAEHMESLLLFDSWKEVTMCNLLKIFLVHGTMINLRVCLGQYQDWWWWLHPARLKAQAHCSCSDPYVTCPE